MSIEEKVEYYYNQMVLMKEMFRWNRRNKYLACETDLKESLKFVIETNNEHLLTNGLLAYLITENLECDLPDIIKSLTDYTKAYSIIKKYMRCFCESHSHFKKVFTEYELDLNKRYIYLCEIIEANKKTSGCYYYLLLNIIETLLTYIFINREDPLLLESYASDYLNDIDNKLDEMALQGLYQTITEYFGIGERTIARYNSDKITEYVINKIGCKNLIEIR